MLYFKHHSNMRNDVKLKRVISRYGLEGYGLYNLILESITESLSTDSPLPDLQENCEDIAEFYNGNTAKINEMMNFMINQGLFDIDEVSGHVLCAKLYKFLDTSQTRSEKIREMIKAYKEQTKLLPETNYLPSQTVSDKSDRIEENRKEKKIVKHKHGLYKNVLLSDDELSRLTTEWGKSETERMIKQLDEGIELKGYKYKNHNLALRKWKEKEKPLQTSKTEREYNIPKDEHCSVCGHKTIKGFCANCGDDDPNYKRGE